MVYEKHIIPPGLSQNEIDESHRKYGLNIDKSHDFTTLKIILKTLFSVFNVVMAVLVVVLFLINEKETAQFIGIVAVINTTIELVQEIRARLIVKKLGQLSEKTTNVVRGGRVTKIPLGELVIGDIIYLTSGDRVPVDGEVTFSEYAEFDESILTGESRYIPKTIGQEIRAGSFISAGSCYFKMTKFARDSYIQTLTKQISKQGITESPLQSQINQIIKVLTYMTIFFIALLGAEGLVQGNRTAEIIINASTLITSMVPQGLVLVTTISFAYGAMKIAKNQAIVQKLSAIEAMADTKVVCMDKTGTLTKNALEVKEIKWVVK